MNSLFITLPVFNFFLLVSNGAFAQVDPQPINQVEKAEVQFEICEPDVDTLLQKLRLSPSPSKTKQVFYHDTESLDLIRQNVVIKIKSASSQNQSNVKIKDLDEDLIPWDDLKGHDYKCEFDLYLDLSRFSCGINHVMKNTEDILAESQLNLIKTTGLNPIYENMKSFGPVATAEQTVSTDKHKLVIESSAVDGKLAAIELSTRVDIKDAFNAQTEIKERLQQSKVTLCLDQQGKIKRIFELLKPSN